MVAVAVDARGWHQAREQLEGGEHEFGAPVEVGLGEAVEEARAPAPGLKSIARPLRDGDALGGDALDWMPWSLAGHPRFRQLSRPILRHPERFTEMSLIGPSARA